MSENQTRTQRRAERADARRRNLNRLIERLVAEQPKHRALADQLSGSLMVLGPDEIELAERLSFSVVGAIEAGTWDGWLAPDPIFAISAVASRLLRGRASYGEMALDVDPRDFALERDEELADAVVYDAMSVVQIERCGGDEAVEYLTSRSALAALHNVGQHVQHSTLAALQQKVIDQERPTPFAIPEPWCLGSALIFQHGAVRIESNTIVAVRCHHCGREWSLADQELRISGSGQYVIPTHEGTR